MNPEFLKAKASWKPRDNIKANMDATKSLVPRMEVDKWWEREERPVYVYSGQKMQYTEWQKELIRERAQKDPDNHYTYSLSYLSGSLCPVNAEQLAEDAERARKAKFITPGGFKY